MKKRLESELISIAHRILKLKNKSEVDQLYKETQKLYETLAVLKFYQDNFESVKSEVSAVVLEEKLEQFNQIEPVSEAEEAEVVEMVPKAESEVTDAVSEAESIVSPEPEKTVEEELEEEPTLAEEEDPSDSELAEQIIADEKPSFEPIFELEVEEEVEEEVIPADVHEQREEKLEDHIGKYADPVFVKPNEVSLFPSETKEDTSESGQAQQTKSAPISETPKSLAGHDGMSKSIAIGLNDRIGFVQHLFNDSNEDFNRVISQLNTFDTFEEAKNFINEMVIPDYNYWVGEEDYIERFMEVVEKKFA